MKTIFSIVLLLVIGFTGCQRKDCLSALANAANLMNEHPDSALRTLQTISTDDLNKKSDRAEYALLYSQAIDKNYIDSDNDSLIRIAVDYYDRHGSATQKAWAYFYQARIYENAGDIETAMSLFLKAESHAEKNKEYYLWGMVFNRKALLYSKQSDYDHAIPMYLASAKNYAHTNYKRNEMYVYDGLSRAYHMNGDISLAMQTLGKTQQIAEELCDTTTILRCAVYHANTLYEELNDPQAALDILEKTYKHYNSAFQIDIYPLLSHIYLKKGDYARARDYAKKYEQSELSLRQRVGILSFCKEIEYQAGNYRGYIHYSKQYIKLADSLSKIDWKNSLFEIEQKYNQESLLVANATLAKENKLHWIIIGLISSILMLGFIFFYHRQKHLNAQIKDYQESVDDAQKQCTTLQQIQTELNNGNEYLQVILADRIEILKEILELGGKHRGDSEEFLSKFKEYIKDDEKHNLSVIFRDIIESQQPGILGYLKSRYPDLTEEDIDLYCQICGGCSVDVICLASNNAPKYIYNKRTGLRKKLIPQEDEKKTLLDHLTQLIKEFRQIRITSKDN